VKIFFVKSLYRAATTGRASNVDRNFDPTITLVEERIVMFAAADADDALRQAAREARASARDMHVNPYGRRVKTRFLGALSAYESFATPASGLEIFSETEVVSASVPDDEDRPEDGPCRVEGRSCAAHQCRVRRVLRAARGASRVDEQRG
jgi:hypothetical protein